MLPVSEGSSPWFCILNAWEGYCNGLPGSRVRKEVVRNKVPPGPALGDILSLRRPHHLCFQTLPS